MDFHNSWKATLIQPIPEGKNVFLYKMNIYLCLTKNGNVSNELVRCSIKYVLAKTDSLSWAVHLHVLLTLQQLVRQHVDLVDGLWVMVNDEDNNEDDVVKNIVYKKIF